MKVFISWSGAKSLAVAEVLREELPCLINELETFVSAEDIEKGTAWFPKIANELEQSNFAIICLTPENLQSRWLHFEAGVLAGKFSQTKVAPLLIELDNIAQVPPPLSELQLTKFAKQDFFKLLCALNKNTSKPLSDSVLKTNFERSWEPLTKKIQEKIAALPASQKPQIVKRSPDEILEEILDIVRSLRRTQPSQPNRVAGIIAKAMQEAEYALQTKNGDQTIGNVMAENNLDDQEDENIPVELQPPRSIPSRMPPPRMPVRKAT
jgi:hypothetical protein